MPYKSQAQAGYFHTHEKELAAQGVDVSEWDAASKGMHLPKRAPKAHDTTRLFRPRKKTSR